ncbi:uncharacterized protein [Drosophila takahashii]|uniref:uncharacterized protein isoform X2 n=1 Tax=Drosophila takahashii TaxID=29030 RepID=UPI0038995708
MSCISSNFSSFFLNSLNDPSEFSKYLSNGELKCTNFEEFQVFGCGAGAPTQQQQQQQLQQQQHYQQYSHTHLPNGSPAATAGADFPNYEPTQTSHRENSSSANSGSSVNPAHYASAAASASAGVEASVAAAPTSSGGAAAGSTPLTATPPSNRWPTAVATPNGHQATASAAGSVPQHFDGSFEFIKYLRHSTDFTPSSASSASESIACPEKSVVSGKPGIPAGTTPPPPAQSPVASGLIDLDTSTSQKSRSASRKVAALLSSVSRASNSLVDTSSSALDVFDHDSKQTIFDLQHMASNGSSNSNESSLEMLAFPNSHLNASNSNTSSEGAACGSAGEFGGLLTGASCSSSTASSSSHAPKLLGSFVIKENFEVHPSHKVEEGIFQHMNKLPSKKKDTLKQLGVRFTGQMTLTDKSIVVENFIKFCEEYDIKDHRPWLSLNQCGLNKPEQIKFARYLGQGLPTFTLFCIYSNFKNLFCTKRTEIYTKDGYNLPYILDKTKRFLANTTAGDNTNNNNNITNNTSNKTNNNTSTTSTSTPVKQTPQQQQQQSEQDLLAPNSPATPKLAAAAAAAAAQATATAATATPVGAVTPTQTLPRTRPATPTMPAGAAAGTPTTPQQQQQQQQHLQQQHQQQQHQQQHMLQHPHPHPHAQLSHPHTLPHSHPHHLQPGTPTRSSHPQLQHPHHYPPSPHAHPHHHPHAHHAFAYGHGHPHPQQQQHHPHYYPHPHAHVQHMAAMGYPQAAGGAGGVGGAGGAGATGAGAAGGAGGGGLPPTAM